VIGSYLSVGVRHLLAQKLYSSINIVGLAVGLAAAIVIFLYVDHELGFDERFPNADRIYRISAVWPSESGGTAVSPATNVHPAAPQLKLDFAAEIQESARIWGTRVRLRRGANTFYEDGFRFADPSFFDIFELDWLAGDPRRALAEPSTVVLTESLARKYFGDDSPMGQTLLLENEWPITVTGVIRDLPRDTHLSASAIASFDLTDDVLGFDYAGNWSFMSFHTYALLKPGARIESVASRFGDFVARHRRPGDGVATMIATPLTDVHLDGRQGELTPPASVASLTTFGAVALCIMLIACMNFTNLATARATQRAREVGMRKALGAARAQLVVQFLGEAILYVAVAMLLAMALVEVLLPPFNAFTGAGIEFDYLRDLRVPAVLAGLVVLVGLTAGTYPALYLAAFDPAQVLRGDATRGAAGARLRGALVVVQFAISIVLLVVTATIYRQTEFARNLDRGFETEQIVVLTGSAKDGMGAGFGALRQRLLENPEITAVISGSMRGAGARRVRAEGGDPGGLELLTKGVDFGFFEAHGIELVAGRTFAEQYGADDFVLPTNDNLHTTGAYVLNELAARELGWTPEEALGKWFETDFAADFSRSVRGPIVGVVKDTYMRSVRERVQPLVYFAAARTWADAATPWFTDASVRVTGRRVADTLAYIDAAWAELEPNQPLTRYFLDDSFAALYDNEERQARMFGAFALLAVVIACLGLFGLASFTTERRTKEIGIRKTLGGSMWDVVSLLTADFSKLVLIANLLAWPVAYLLMQRWLAGFAYRIDLGAWVFVGSGLAALAIAWLTVGTVAARAAAAKPVTSLRHE
jgi:putative ABC transport system permease protein